MKYWKYYPGKYTFILGKQSTEERKSEVINGYFVSK